MSDCLTDIEFEGILGETLSCKDLARVESHLAGCERCRSELEDRRNDNRLFMALRRALREDGAPTLPSGDHASGDAEGLVGGCGKMETVAGYDILSEIHRGGQGIVYKAIQKATKRTVALKVLLQGPYASPKQRHRFEREIDLVAALRHPNVVTIYDSGVTRDDRHYFAMEYIHGQPLDAYLSAASLSVKQTLVLFQKICAAVNYAHQRGVIHRDLKPGNIRIDTDGQPHILDFGLAKVAGPGVLDGAPMTLTGEFLGTLAYASPEQAKGDPSQIDIRTDVYSLGVILYEMLTGKYPYTVAGHMAEVLKNIAEAAPQKPSTIRRQIDDEVETIVMKALAKEKERRYQSAENLASDVQHYLADEPIEAKRDSTWYVVRKSLRRHRLLFAAGAAFVLLLTAATIALSIMYGNQRRERDRAQTAETFARAEAEHALREAAKASRIQEFLENMLSSADPHRAQQADVTVREVLDKAAATARTELADQPEVLACVLETIARTYIGLVLWSPAMEHLREAVEIRRRLVAEADADDPSASSQRAALEKSEQLVLLYTSERVSQSVSEVRKAHRIAADALGESHMFSASLGVLEDLLDRTSNDLGENGLWLQVSAYINALDETAFSGPCAESAREVKRRWKAGDVDGAGALVAAEYERVSERWEQLTSSGGNDEVSDQLWSFYRPALGTAFRPAIPFSMTMFAARLAYDDKWAAAGIVAQEAMQSARETYGESSVAFKWARAVEAVINHVKDDSGDTDRYPSDAEEYIVEAIQATRTGLGSTFLQTIGMLIARGGEGMRKQGELAKAERYDRLALSGCRRALGDDDHCTLCLMTHLAGVLRDQKRWDEAERYCHEAFEGFRRTRGEDDAFTLHAMGQIAKMLTQQGKTEEAEECRRRQVDGYRRAKGAKDPDALVAAANLAVLLRDQGKLVDAEQLHAEVVAGAREALPEGHKHTAVYLWDYAVCLKKLERYPEAEAALLEAYRILATADDPDRDLVARLIAHLLDLYKVWVRPDQAAEWRAKLDQWKATTQSATQPTPTAVPVG